MSIVDDLEHRMTLTSAVARYESLRRRDSQVEFSEADEQGVALGRGEMLELLALAEIIARKVSYGRQLVVGRAREAGAACRQLGGGRAGEGGAWWADIGQALGVPRQSAWEAHTRWIDGQAAQHQV